MWTKWAIVIIGIVIAWRWMSPKAPLTKEKLSKEYDYVIGNGDFGYSNII